MNIYLLNKNFELIEIIDVFNSLIWDRKYYECGCFELHASIDCFNAFQQTKYVSVDGFSETGVVDNYGCNKVESSAYIKGLFMESVLGKYIIDTTQNLSGTPEEINRKLVNTFQKLSPEHPWPILTAPISGIGSPTKLQTTWDNLIEKCYEIAKTQEQSVLVSFDFQTNQATFSTWQGKDRTENQTENTWATFSDDYENVISTSYSKNWRDYRNFAYVAGAGEGSGRFVVPVDRVKPGEEIRELYVDARDLQIDESGNTNYVEQLTQRGLEKLARSSEPCKIVG